MEQIFINNCNFYDMKKFTIALIVLASLILFIGANKDRFVKMKVLTQVLRLVMDNYVEDVDIDDILDLSLIHI